MIKKSFAVLGAGRFGRSIAEALYTIGEEVLVIDKNETAAEAVAENVTQTVIGNYSEEAVLRAAGVQNVDTVIIASSSDVKSSILAAVILREMGVKYIIARAADKTHAKILEKIDVDTVIMPERDMGERLAHKLTSSNFLEYIELSDSFSIAEVNCPSKFFHKTIKDIDIRNKYKVNIIAIENNGEVNAAPMPGTKLRSHDVLIIIGSNKDIEDFKNL
ncbi:MAG: TrkA family potassium uptake protein [Oscillospiraceae bacterium]|nr:TrkA family potassium uptake protein [Oscillospiraceae bacterium]